MTTPTLFFGNSVVDASTRLMPVSFDDMYHRMRDDRDLRERVERLRRVKQLDKAAYTRMKVGLPFICCGTFRDGVRRMDHFVQIESFVLDVDKYATDVAELELLKERLRADVRVCMVFTSPGGDGVKIVFLMDRPVCDTKEFSDFYKAFAYRFGEQYGLTDKLDFRTFDVSRVCFLSSDAGAYFDPLCDQVEVDAYLQTLPHHAAATPARLDATLLTAPVGGGNGIGGGVGGVDMAAMVTGADDVAVLEEAATEVPFVAPKPAAVPTPAAEPVNRSHQIAPDVYKLILQRLGTQARPNPQVRAVVVPDVMSTVVEPVRAALAAQGIVVESVEPINYGQKWVLSSGRDRAEMNVYYGAKKGFSVVGVPKAQTHSDLMQLCVFVCEQAIYAGL
jgi:VirE N-terminal domain